MRSRTIGAGLAAVLLASACPMALGAGSVFGEGGQWDKDFAARQLEKFKSIQPNPEVLTQIEDMGDNDWLTLPPNGDEAPESGRGEVPMVYMPDFKACAFISGCTSPGYSSDTWFYVPSANRWVQMWPNYIKGAAASEKNRGPMPEDRPMTRCSLGLAYDSDFKLLVNRGGANAGTRALRTYVLDVANNKWEMTVDEKGPGPKDQGDNNMGFVPGLGVVEVVRGGKVRVEGPCRMYDASSTWLYRTSEKKWEKLAVKTQAPGAHNARMVWNSVEKKLIYHTGAEIWAFDPQKLDWENLTPETSGPPRYRHGNAYDPFHNVLITYGGKEEDSLWVFEFASKTWKEMKSDEMPKRAGQRMLMCFDSELNVVVMKAGGNVQFYRYKRK